MKKYLAKHICTLLFFALFAHGQSGTIPSGELTLGSFDGLVNPRAAAGKPSGYIVWYEETEKCHACSFRHAAFCTTPDCNVPDTVVTRYVEATDLKHAKQIARGLNADKIVGPIHILRVFTVQTAEVVTKQAPQPPKEVKEVVVK